MAYNLESLVKVIELILCPDQRKLYNKKAIQQVESLLEKACFLRDSLANSTTFGENRIASFEDQIGDAAQDAEDVLETYATDHLSTNGSGLQFLAKWIIPPPNLRRLLEKFDSTKEEMMKINSDGAGVSSSPSSAVSSRIDQNPKKIVVGFTNDLLQLMERVSGDSTKLEIIPIVGMGGIGKTTLARKIYDDSYVVTHFDARAWTTVSDDYSLRDILLDLLGCITGRHRDEMNQEKDNQLAVTLHQNLIGRRYLIVLDDIWRSKAWDDVKTFFPNEKNGSRVILTTRESNVATYADSKSLHHQVRPLSQRDSWKLLREKVFGEETSFPELEELGIKIANDCGGLPLAIHVVGGLLSHTRRTKDSWKQVAADVSSAIANKEKQFSKILSLSYDHLPYYLKPCFLYMSAFPEDYEISASKLIRLWVAEGFLKPIEGKSLEEAAEEHLKALIDRNLIFVHQRKTNGKVKTCIMHDLLRDLCVMKAHEKNFFHVMNGQTHNIPGDMLCQRRVSVNTSRCNEDICDLTGQMSLARSLIFIGRRESPEIRPPPFSALRLLRVLDVLIYPFDRFPREILQLVNLRYLAFTCCWDQLHPFITTLRNLQTLIVDVMMHTKVSHDIFDMPHLREIRFIRMPVGCDLKKPKSVVLQENLHSVSTLQVCNNLDLLLAKLPNLKNLAIQYCHGSDSENVDLTRLLKLETLKCSIDFSANAEIFFLSKLSFPISLKKLNLINCKVLQGFMKTIGMLPNLETLKLSSVRFESETWEPCEGEFCKLRFLVLESLDLVRWLADETHYPRLEHLIIRHCYSLDEIPSGIGEISTLKLIEVFFSGSSVVTSVRKIQKEQLELGNSLLQFQLSSFGLSRHA